MIRTTLAQARQFILQKNYLTGAPPQSLLTLIQELGGLPTLPPMTPHLAAQSRLRDFSPGRLRKLLQSPRRLIQSPLMRSTPYLVPVEMFAVWHAATARQRNQSLSGDFRLWGIETNDEVAAWGTAVLDVLDDAPAAVEEIQSRLPREMVKEFTQTSRGGRVSRTSSVVLALAWLVGQGKLAMINAEDGEAWQNEPPFCYAPLTRLYPDLDLSQQPTEAEAQKQVVQAYLAAFGPATEADISFWTGFGKSETARAVGSLSSETTLTMVQGIPGMLLMLKDQASALLATAAAAGPVVSVLPANDPFTTAHRASRSRYFVNQQHQRRVFSSSGQARPTILLDGQIVGAWAWEDDNSPPPRLLWQLLAEVESGLLPRIEAELARTARFIDPQAQVEKTP